MKKLDHYNRWDLKLSRNSVIFPPLTCLKPHPQCPKLDHPFLRVGGGGQTCEADVGDCNRRGKLPIVLHLWTGLVLMRLREPF